MNTPSKPAFDSNTPTDVLIKRLSLSRETHANYKDIMNTILEQAKATGDYQFAEDGAKSETEEIDALTAEIKSRAVAEYLATQNKKPFAGVTVKIFKVFKVKDQASMEAWVEKNLAAAISRVFDMKLIETFAKSAPIPGTEITEEARAEIAKELP